MMILIMIYLYIAICYSAHTSQVVGNKIIE